MAAVSVWADVMLSLWPRPPLSAGHLFLCDDIKLDDVFFAAAVVYLIFNMVFAGLYALGDHPVANLTPDNFLGYFSSA
jgi:pilus assembly protein TadC